MASFAAEAFNCVATVLDPQKVASIPIDTIPAVVGKLQLLVKLNSVLTIDWQKTAQARARVRDAIETELDEGLPRAYTPDLFKTKAGAVFQHVYDKHTRVA